MKSPRIGFKTIDAVATIICGDGVDINKRISPYRTHAKLREFFVEDLAIEQPPTVEPDSRPRWTASWLKGINGTPALKKVIEAAVRPADYEASEYPVEGAVAYLNRFLAHDGVRLIKSGKRFVLTEAGDVRMPDAVSAHEILSDEYVQELSGKCDARLGDSDFEGAITTGRTMLEAVLAELERHLLGDAGDHKGDLQRQFKAVAKQLGIDAGRAVNWSRFGGHLGRG